MCYGTKTVKWGAVAVSTVFPSGQPTIPPERLAIDDLPPIEQVQIVEVPFLDTTEIVVQKPAEPRQAAITPDPVPTTTSEVSTPGRLPAPARQPVPVGGRLPIYDRLCRPGYC